MVASRWLQRLALAGSVRRATSASVRYSPVRRSAFGRRGGRTVRFSVAGATSLRCDFIMIIRLLDISTVRKTVQKGTVVKEDSIISRCRCNHRRTEKLLVL